MDLFGNINMKQVIRIKLFDKECLPKISDFGDWIDLRAAADVHIDSPYASTKSKKGGETTRKVKFTHQYVPLGIAMQLPKGMEALVAPRSSSIKNFNFIQPNSPAVIDNSYNGDKDEWKGSILCVGDVNIKKGDRICQFRILPSQKATVWQKLKWLFSSGVEIRIVDSLGNENRGGLGSTGVQ